MQWLNLIRWKNLTIMLCMMLISGWVLHVTLSMNFVLLIGCVIISAAAGNIWNDLNDQKADEVNKPEMVWVGRKIPGIQALIVYWTLFGIATLFSLILFFQGFPYVLVITLIAQVLLFLYSVSFKRLAVIGNFIISLLIWMSFLIMILYANDAEEIPKRWAMHLGMLAFFTTWIREAVKDMQDAPGDREANYRTLAVIWPVSYVKTYVFLILIVYLSYVTYYILSNNWLTIFPLRLIPYLIVLLIPPAWIAWRIWVAETSGDYKLIGKMIKIWMVIGILSTILWNGIVF